MSQNSDWLRRRNSIDQELGGHEDSVADVRIVQSDIFRTSRERGPCARHFGTIVAPAAGHQAGIRVDAVDGSPESQRTVMCAVHQWTVSGACTAFLSPRVGLTLTQTEITTFASKDPDLRIRPRLYEVDFASANVPTAVGTPAVVKVCSTNIQSHSNYTAPTFMPGYLWFESTADLSFYLVLNAAATAFHYSIEWQGIRL